MQTPPAARAGGGGRRDDVGGIHGRKFGLAPLPGCFHFMDRSTSLFSVDVDLSLLQVDLVVAYCD